MVASDSECSVGILKKKKKTEHSNLDNIDQEKFHEIHYSDEEDVLESDRSSTFSNFSDDVEDVENVKSTNSINRRIVRRASSISKSGLRPFFLSNFNSKNNEKSFLPDITINNPNDKTEKTEAFRKVIKYFHENFKGEDTPTVSFTNTNIPKDIKKFINIIQDANIDFTIDLPLHLYNAYLLSTRNKYIPGFEFTAWPLPSKDMITPRDYLFDTNFTTLGSEAKAFNEEMRSERFSKVNYVANQKKISPKLSMTCFWHPKINAYAEMDECIDAIFEQNINRRITRHIQRNVNHLINGTTIQRKDPIDLVLDPVLKKNLYIKLDKTIDKMVDTYINAEKKVASVSSLKRFEIPVSGLNWLDVASQLDQDDQKSRTLLFKLFRNQLKRDHINGPVDRYPHEFESFSHTEEHKYKVLKRLIRKRPKYGHKDEKRRRHLIKDDLGSFLNLKVNKSLH